MERELSSIIKIMSVLFMYFVISETLRRFKAKGVSSVAHEKT